MTRAQRRKSIAADRSLALEAAQVALAEAQLAAAQGEEEAGGSGKEAALQQQPKKAAGGRRKSLAPAALQQVRGR